MEPPGVPTTNLGLAIWADNGTSMRRTELLYQLLAEVPEEAFNTIIVDLKRCWGSFYVYQVIEKERRDERVCTILKSDPADHRRELRHLILASPELLCESLLLSAYDSKERRQPEAFGTNALAILCWYRPILQSYILRHMKHGFERLAKMGKKMRPVGVVLRGLFEHELVERERYLARILTEVWKYYSGPAPNLKKLTQMLQLLHDLFELPVDADTVMYSAEEIPIALATIIDGLRDKLLEPGKHCRITRAIHTGVLLLRKTIALVKVAGGPGPKRVMAVGALAHPLTGFYYRIAFEVPAELRDCGLRDLAAANTYWPPALTTNGADDVDPPVEHWCMEQFLAEMVQRATWTEILQLAQVVDAFHFAQALCYLLKGYTEGPFISGPGLLRCVNLVMRCMLEHYLPEAAQDLRRAREVLPLIQKMLDDIRLRLDEAPCVLREIESYNRAVDTTNVHYRAALNAVRLAARKAILEHRRQRHGSAAGSALESSVGA